MKDITHKPETLRSARATASIKMPASCVELLRARATEKGDALEVARTAGIMAAKRTWELLPFCHPLPLQNIVIGYELHADSVTIETEVQVVSGTGVEMEALTAASITALTLYDMLKPHAGLQLSISDIRLLVKRGGKSEFNRRIEPPVRAAVLVVSQGKKTGRAGETVRDGLSAAGIETEGYELLETSSDKLNERVRHWLAQGADLIVTIGGTGIAPDDHAVDIVRKLIEREMPGIMEAARAYGQRRTPYAMISRGVAGLTGNTLLITFPGSTRGAQETLNALLPGLVHTLETIRRGRHLPT